MYGPPPPLPNLDPPPEIRPAEPEVLERMQHGELVDRAVEAARKFQDLAGELAADKQHREQEKARNEAVNRPLGEADQPNRGERETRRRSRPERRR
jgi:hypothetical protein